jgi:hypothetical protein
MTDARQVLAFSLRPTLNHAAIIETALRVLRDVRIAVLYEPIVHDNINAVLPHNNDVCARRQTPTQASRRIRQQRTAYRGPRHRLVA